MKKNKIYNCDTLEGLKRLEDKLIQCVITSPPYWGLRNYKVEGQLGLEKTPDEYVNNLVKVFDEVWRVLRDDGTVWLNLGDTFSSYKDQSVRHQTVAGGSRDEPSKGQASNRDGKVLKACGLKHKELVGIPWRVAFALQKAGWYLRSDIIWAKAISFCATYVGGCMPESCKDRPTRSHEYIFLLTKQPNYFYDQEAIKEDGVYPKGTKAAKGSGAREGNRREAEYATYSGKRNPRSVWAIQTKPYKEAHFATFPEKLIEPMIKAGTSEKGCCSKCGASWRRVVDKITSFESNAGRAVNKSGKITLHKTDLQGNGRTDVANNTRDMRLGPVVSSATIGWEKTCSCEDSEIVPCVVLDPFMGSGTSAVVAKRLGRDYIGFELNKSYVEIAEKRINECE